MLVLANVEALNHANMLLDCTRKFKLQRLLHKVFLLHSKRNA